MSGPATYRIRVRGRIDPDEVSRLWGLTVRPGDADAADLTTTLEGVLQDQAALAGVLNALYARLLPVLSVEFLAPSDTDWKHLYDHGGES